MNRITSQVRDREQQRGKRRETERSLAIKITTRSERRRWWSSSNSSVLFLSLFLSLSGTQQSKWLFNWKALKFIKKTLCLCFSRFIISPCRLESWVLVSTQCHVMLKYFHIHPSTKIKQNEITTQRRKIICICILRTHSLKDEKVKWKQRIKV